MLGAAQGESGTKSETRGVRATWQTALRGVCKDGANVENHACACKRDGGPAPWKQATDGPERPVDAAGLGIDGKTVHWYFSSTILGEFVAVPPCSSTLLLLGVSRLARDARLDARPRKA